MLCVFKDQKLSRFLDGELTAAEEGSVRAHLEHCLRCRRRLSSFQRVDVFAAELTMPLTRGAFSPPRRGWGPDAWVYSIAMAAAFLASLALNLLLPDGTRVPDSPEPIGRGGAPRHEPDRPVFLERSGPSDAVSRLYLQLAERSVER